MQIGVVTAACLSAAALAAAPSTGASGPTNLQATSLVEGRTEKGEYLHWFGVRNGRSSAIVLCSVALGVTVSGDDGSMWAKSFWEASPHDVCLVYDRNHLLQPGEHVYWLLPIELPEGSGLLRFSLTVRERPYPKSKGAERTVNIRHEVRFPVRTDRDSSLAITGPQ